MSGTQWSRHRNLAALIVGAVAIGFAPIFVRMSETGPVSTAFWRIAIALPFMAALAVRLPKGEAVAGKSGWLPMALAGICFAIDLALWHWSIHFTSVANATLEANLSAIFVTGLAWVLFREKVTRRFLFAVLLAFAGTALLIGKNLKISPKTLQGDVLGILTAVFYSGYILSVKVARDRGLGTSKIMAVSGVITVVVLLPIVILSGEKALPATSHGWLVVCGLAILSHLFGQSLIAYALAGLPASFAAVGLLVQPATAAVAAWILLGESLSAGQMAGGVILLAGICLARRNPA